jgi:nucleotide-binding universal stress UspA family protein
MKSILVAISGSTSDILVLEAAHAVAESLNAHLDFIHIPLASIEVASVNRHIEFARGNALDIALEDILPRSEDAETKARAHIRDFCASRSIAWISEPIALDQVTASWRACPNGMNAEGFLRAARAHDLTVIGRSAGKRSWSQNLLENLTANSGRPVLIVPSNRVRFKLDKVAVWWKDHSAAARAITAALPLLGAARQVTLYSVQENGDHAITSTEEVARQLGWHGIEASSEVLARDHRSMADSLWSATLAGKSDIVVMGGFSRSRIKEIIFGGCTQSVLDHGPRPVFLVH